ncbi:MAG: 4-hydroxybenzoate octaprenyltransferase [Pelagibacteraceae bacterium]
MKKYIELIRLDKPTGIFLLYWPCTWGLTVGNIYAENNDLFLKYLILFFIGSFLMRSAGCIYNDIIDKNIDKKITRTKNRPIAKGSISTKQGWFAILVLILLSLTILLQLNLNSIIFGLASGFFIILYPFMKRITYWPQLFLGITFNWGVILGWLAMGNELSLIPILLYFSAILWTLGYDTIYGMQDLKDDLKIGVKSTSIKFEKNFKTFLGINYFISFALLIICLKLLNADVLSYLLAILSGIILIIQIFSHQKNNSDKNFKLFALNNYYGLSVFITLIVTATYG